MRQWRSASSGPRRRDGDGPRLGCHHPVERQDRVRRAARRLGVRARCAFEERSSGGYLAALRSLTQESQRRGSPAWCARSPGLPVASSWPCSDPRAAGQPVLTIPITPKEHGTTFLFEHRHLWLRSRRQVAIARVRHEVVQAIRDFFYQRGFTLVDTPDPDRRHRRGSREPLRDRLLRPGQGLPGPDRPALRRGRGGGARARSTASAPPSGPRSRRPAAISPSSGWSSPRSPSTTPTPTCGSRKTSSATSWPARSIGAARS